MYTSFLVSSTKKLLFYLLLNGIILIFIKVNDSKNDSYVTMVEK